MISLTRQDLVVFLISFCVGLIVIGLMEERPEVIVRWPTPKNAGLVTYVDRASNCYKYEAKQTECGDDAKNIPISTGEGFHEHHSFNTDAFIHGQGTPSPDSVPQHATSVLLQPKPNAPAPTWEGLYLI